MESQNGFRIVLNPNVGRFHERRREGDEVHDMRDVQSVHGPGRGKEASHTVLEGHRHLLQDH